jgi:hypothetical protein
MTSPLASAAPRVPTRGYLQRTLSGFEGAERTAFTDAKRLFGQTRSAPEGVRRLAWSLQGQASS